MKLRYVDAWNEARRAHAKRYDAVFGEYHGVRPPVEAAYGTSVYNRYTIRVGNRERVQQVLKEEYGVETVVNYYPPLHLQPMMAHFGYRAGDLLEAERAAEEVLCIPMYPELSEAQIHVVTHALMEVTR